MSSVRIAPTAAAILLLLFGSSTAATHDPDSIDTFGIWRWVESQSNDHGLRNTPADCGCNRYLLLLPSGRFELMEQDSLYSYMLCRGAFEIHRSRGLQPMTTLGLFVPFWLSFAGWWIDYEEDQLIWFAGRDTLSMYPGATSTGIAHALTHKFVRVPNSQGGAFPLPTRQWATLDQRPARATTDRILEKDLYFYKELEPVPIHKVQPIYPEFAKEAQIRGSVTLHLLVAPDGHVKNIKVMRGVKGLDDAAVAAVKQWRFKPAVHGHDVVSSWFEVTFEFPP